MKKIIALSLVCFTLAIADEKKENPFVTHTELGYVSTSGNTDTKSGSLDFMGKKSWDKDAVQLDVDYIYGEQDGIENKNRLDSKLNYDHSFTESFGFNYLVGYKDDKFSGFDYQFYTGPGVKYTAIKGKVHNLTLQSNILYSLDQQTDKYYSDAALTVETPYPYVPVRGAFKDPNSGQSSDYSAFFIQGDYSWQITDATKFVQMLSYRVDMGDTDIYFMNSKTGVESKFSDILSMGLNYKINYVNQAPAGNVNTDKTFMVSLIIDY